MGDTATANSPPVVQQDAGLVGSPLDTHAAVTQHGDAHHAGHGAHPKHLNHSQHPPPNPHAVLVLYLVLVRLLPSAMEQSPTAVLTRTVGRAPTCHPAGLTMACRSAVHSDRSPISAGMVEEEAQEVLRDGTSRCVQAACLRCQ